MSPLTQLNNTRNNEEPKIMSFTSNYIDQSSKTYLVYKILINIFLLYGCILLIQYIVKRYIGYRKRQEHFKKQQQKLIWKKAIMGYTMMHQTHNRFSNVLKCTVRCKPHNYPSTSSSFTLKSNSSHTVIHTDAISIYSVGPSESRQKSSSDSQTAKNITKESKLVSDNKRLSLLWQWGKTMGYCEYDHAKKMSQAISVLQKKQEEEETESLDSALESEEKQK